MAIPTLLDYQFWFGLDGVGTLFGMNTEVDVVTVDGLESFDVRSGSRELPRDDGSVPGFHLVTSKTPIFELDILGDTEYYEQLEFFKPYRNHEGELHWKFPGRSQVFMRGRPRGRTAKRDGFTSGKIPVTLAFEMADPRIYGVDQEQQIFIVFNPERSGLDWNVDWNIDFTTPGGGSDVVATNDGNVNAYPIIRIYGPVTGSCDGVLVRNLTTGVDLEIQAAMTTGQVLTVDMDARQRGSGARIIDLSGVSKYGAWTLPRDTFFLQPGDNILRLSLFGGTSADVQGIVYWRDTSY